MECKKQNKKTSKLECLIDKKVYALYALDEEEINLIESSYNGQKPNNKKLNSRIFNLHNC